MFKRAILAFLLCFSNLALHAAEVTINNGNFITPSIMMPSEEHEDIPFYLKKYDALIIVHGRVCGYMFPTLRGSFRLATEEEQKEHMDKGKANSGPNQILLGRDLSLEIDTDFEVQKVLSSSSVHDKLQQLSQFIKSKYPICEADISQECLDRIVNLKEGIPADLKHPCIFPEPLITE